MKINYETFYEQLYAPLTRALGPLGPETIAAIVGFDMGGPLSFRTIGGNSGFVTYVSCELAVRDEQQASSFGRFEVLATCDSEEWVRSVLTGVGAMSLEVAFDDGHTLDIGGWVNTGWLKRKPPLQGLLFSEEYGVNIDGQPYGVMRCVGITRQELKFAQSKSVPELVAKLSQAGIYPNTLVGRASVV